MDATRQQIAVPNSWRGLHLHAESCYTGSFVQERKSMSKGIFAGLLSCAVLIAPPLGAFSQFSPSPVSASAIPADHLIQAPDLAHLLRSGKQQPLILQVGSHLFFNEAHIKGSQYAGAGSQLAGLQLLERTVANLPKDRFIVLYCGCCPWNRCPNVGPAFDRLRDLGYSRVKVLYLPSNFGDDWVAKGYPTDRNP